MFCINCGNEINKDSKFCTKCGNKSEQTQYGMYNKKLFINKKFLAPLVFVGVITIIFLFYYQNPIEKKNDYNTASVVVNIYCMGESEEDVYGGSGTMFSEDGLILTNAHIIPESALDDVYVDDTLCLVSLPSPETGSSDEIYYAYPILIEGLSDEYDIAFMQIHDVYYDHEEDVVYGEYPKKFTAYADNKLCKEESFKLGEPVRIYGYPEISGGYALTVTDGIISSLLIDEGLIITSAKISYGNSGGLAVDQNGCMIGIPSMVSSDENESLGVIISNDLVNEFIEEVNLLIK